MLNWCSNPGGVIPAVKFAADTELSFGHDPSLKLVIGEILGVV